jgi:cardiolipin synthase (CMP-forming)
MGLRMIWTIPNILTMARVLAVPVIVALMYVPSEAVRWLVALLFAAAALTDWFDGWLARRWGQTSSFGRFLDPIADKLLTSALLVMLVASFTIWGVHVVAVILIISREILISGLREFLAGDNIPVPVTFLAKCKTALQSAAILVLILAPAMGETVQVIGLILLWLATAATVITGGDYLMKGMRHILATDRR